MNDMGMVLRVCCVKQGCDVDLKIVSQDLKTSGHLSQPRELDGAEHIVHERSLMACRLQMLQDILQDFVINRSRACYTDRHYFNMHLHFILKNHCLALRVSALQAA